MFSVKPLCLKAFTTISNMATELWFSVQSLLAKFRNKNDQEVNQTKPNQTFPLIGIFLGLVF